MNGLDGLNQSRDAGVSRGRQMSEPDGHRVNRNHDVDHGHHELVENRGRRNHDEVRGRHQMNEPDGHRVNQSHDVDHGHHELGGHHANRSRDEDHRKSEPDGRRGVGHRTNDEDHGHRHRELDARRRMNVLGDPNRSRGEVRRLRRGVACDPQVTSRGRGLHDHRSSHGHWCDQPKGVSLEPDVSPNPFQRMLGVCPLVLQRARSYPGVRFYRQYLA